jgi:Tfp pilus assembly protein PilV
MYRLMRSLREDQSGVAMVIAIIVMMVVTSIALAVVGLSAHNSTGSATDRNRVTAVNAAEAGLNDWIAAARSSANAACAPTDGSLNTTTPPASFHRTVTLYSTWPPQDGKELACPPVTTPLAAQVSSTGSAVSGSAFATKRTMEMLVKLSAFTGAYGYAIFSNTGLNLSNQLNDNGFQAIDADVYTNGDFISNNNVVITGNAFAEGLMSLSNSTTIKGNGWANGSLSLDNNAQVIGNGTSSTSSISVSGGSAIHGNAISGTTITVSNGSIGGSSTPNSPQSSPPHIDFPQWVYSQSDWTALGYSIQTFSDCTSAKNYLLGTMPTRSIVVRITAVCALQFSNNDQINVRGNLGIVTDGSITTTNQVDWHPVGGPFSVYLMRPYAAGLNCASGNYDFAFSNNTIWESGLTTGIYNACTVHMENLNGQWGQIIANTVSIDNNMTLSFVPLFWPGVKGGGFSGQISYIREIANP